MNKQQSKILTWIIIGGGLLVFFLVVLFALVLYTVRDEDREALSFGDNKIGVIDLDGIIVDSKSLIEPLQRFAENSSIRAIILRIDSPGGGVAASQEIFSEILRLRKAKKKIIVSSMASVGASGAYYIACATDKIVANPGTVTGSIGVIAEWVNYGELMKWAKLKSIVFKSGELKDAPSPVRELTDPEKKYLQNIIDDMYIQFVSAVAAGRKLDVEQVRSLADGRVFTGKDAKARNLIDELGGLQEAVEITSKLAQINGEPKLVYPPKPKKGLWGLLFDDAAPVLSLGSALDSRIQFSYVWK
ncbi:MAG: signal peptide peptidase SppA [Terriglobia bacterium]